jgi:hypothetical protein
MQDEIGEQRLDTDRFERSDRRAADVEIQLT